MRNEEILPLDKRPHTYTGLRYDPMFMTEGDVCLEDIATSLANQCRYNGAVNFHYSVAQHSVSLAHIVPYMLAQRGRFSQATFEREYRDVAAAALMHDATETYIQDFIKPIKSRMSMGGVNIAKVEDKIERTIFSRYGLDRDYLNDVKEFDSRITTNEKRALLPFHRPEQEVYEAIPNFYVTKWTPEFAKQKFLLTALQLEIDTDDLVN